MKNLGTIESKWVPDKKPNATLDYAIFYLTYGLSVIPLRHGEKTPLIKWERYQKEPPSIAEARKWFEGTDNIAIVCGRVSGNLVVVDFDDVEVYNNFLKEVEGDAEELKDIVENTWLVKTGKGYHIYLRVSTDKPIKIGKLPKVDIKGEGGYVVAPPSLHPNGKNYEFLRFTKTTGHEIRVISLEQYNQLLTVLEKATQSKLYGGLDNTKWAGITEPEDKSKDKWRELTDEQTKEIVAALESVYKQGHRHNIIMYLTGWLYNEGFGYESAEKLVKAIIERYQDEEPQDRLYTLKDTYGIGRTPREEKVKAEGMGLKTKNGLIEEITKAAQGRQSAIIATEIIDKIDKTLRHEKNEETRSEANERTITSFDTLILYHDFKHGKAYVSTFKAVIAKVEVKAGKKIETQEIPMVKIDKTYANDNGEIKTVNTEGLKTEFFDIKNINAEVKEYPNLNLPTSIENVRISEVFKEVSEFIKQRIDTVRPEDQIAISIWVIAAYFVPIFQFFPYLAPLKMGYNSGGSELLTVLKRITPRPVYISSPSPASVYRMQEDFSPTMLIDELRNNINKDAFNALYDILVSGYKKGVKIPRVERTREGEVVVMFEPYGAKAIVDQSLITSQYDIASRCLFVRQKRNPDRNSDYTDGGDKDLINKLYSAFLIYGPNAYTLYYNMVDSGYKGRYDQIFRPLIAISRMIDQEDPGLRVEEQLKVVLDDSKSFAEALMFEGDPQRKVVSLINDYVSDSVNQFLTGETTHIPKPWHILEEGEGGLYIFVSDLRKKITEYAMSLHQKDIGYRYDTNGKSAVTEREWEKVDPEVAEMLNGRQFIAILKKFFPQNIRDHRDRPVFVISKDERGNFNFQQPPSRVATEKHTAEKPPETEVFQNGETRQNTSKNAPTSTYSDSVSDSKTTTQNTESNDKLSFNSIVYPTNKHTESEKIIPTQWRLDFDSEIKSMSRNFQTSDSEKNSATQALTGHRQEANSATQALTGKQQEVYDFLKKLSQRAHTTIRIRKLSHDELKLLPELRERDLVHFDGVYVWLTLEGYRYLTDVKKSISGNQ